jgi:hypothetical protein
VGTVPVMHVWVTGEIVTAANLNADTSTLGNFLLAAPMTSVRQTAFQTLVNASFPALQWNVADVNSDSSWSSGSNTRLTSNTTGWYEMSAAWTLVGGATAGRRITVIAVNGAQLNAAQISIPAGGLASTSGIAPSHPVFLNSGDYAEIQAFQDSGSNQNTGSATAVAQAWCRFRWVHS